MRQGILVGCLAASLASLAATPARAQSTSTRRTTGPSPGRYAPIDRTPVMNSTVALQPPVVQTPTGASPVQIPPPSTLAARPQVGSPAERTPAEAQPAARTPAAQPAAPLLDPLARSASSTSSSASRGDMNRAPARPSGDPPAKRKARVAAARKALLDLDRRMAVGRLTAAAAQPTAANAERHSGTLIASGSARTVPAFFNPDPAATRVPATLPASATRGDGVVRAGGNVARPSGAFPPPNIRGSQPVTYPGTMRTGASPAPSPSAYAGYGGTTAQPSPGSPTLLPSTTPRPARNP